MPSAGHAGGGILQDGADDVPDGGRPPESGDDSVTDQGEERANLVAALVDDEGAEEPLLNRRPEDQPAFWRPRSCPL